RERWLASPSVRAYERGGIDIQNFCQSFIQEWQLAISPTQFGERFSSFPKGPYPGVEPLLAELRKSYTVAFLSNCNDLHWAKLLPVLGWAHHAFSSHIMQAVKPDTASFQFVAKELNVSFNEIVFFDDSATNVRAANALGIPAHRTDGFAELATVLERLGFISNGCSRV
uniref:HAD family hydrolase n=1 Tax=Sphingomonas sp. TaxID=28214 RepID=UPI0025CBF37A